MAGESTRNLLHNAIGRTPQGGTLTVHMVVDSGWVALSISDSGQGIPTEPTASLCEPFSVENVRQGSGLGLAICRKITHALGGSISLENRLSHGRVDGA